MLSGRPVTCGARRPVDSKQSRSFAITAGRIEKVEVFRIYAKPIVTRMSLEHETASCKPASGGCYDDHLLYVSRTCTSVAEAKLFTQGGVVLSPYTGPNPSNWYLCLDYNLAFC